ncbi:hypothetical protein T484DRAFT_1658500, partial [Baffinella frigidus]
VSYERGTPLRLALGHRRAPARGAILIVTQPIISFVKQLVLVQIIKQGPFKTKKGSSSFERQRQVPTHVGVPRLALTLCSRSSFVSEFTHGFTHSRTHALAHALTNSRTHELAHSRTHELTHTLTPK